MLGVPSLDKTHEGKRLRVEFSDGEVAEVRVIEVALPNKHATTAESWGIVYDLIMPSRPRQKSEAQWSQFSEIKGFEVLGD
jgi:hypothetical protein